MTDRPHRRRALRRGTQLLSFLGLCLGTLLLLALVTNTMVLPFFNLSGALARAEENVIPTLDKPQEGEGTDRLSFLELLYHLDASTQEGKEVSYEVYTHDSALVLQEIDPTCLPALQEQAGQTALQARQGFLFRHNTDGTQTLLLRDGTVLFERIPEGVTLTGHWDAAERAVFLTGEGPMAYDEQAGHFVKTEYQSELFPISGVDLPVYYNRPTGRIALSYKDGRYGYYYTDTGEANYQYYHTEQSYQFQNGYGALGNEKDGILIVDHTATRYFTAWGHLYQPPGEGVRALGFYRLSYGLMAVWVSDGAGDVVPLVLTEANQIFYLPQDFNLICYTDGVFLLEKDGRYGYLDYTGRWIAQPVYSHATPFSEGLGILTDEAGRVGLIDRDGTFVIPCEMDDITCSGGLVTLFSGGRWVVLSKVA